MLSSPAPHKPLSISSTLINLYKKATGRLPDGSAPCLFTRPNFSGAAKQGCYFDNFACSVRPHSTLLIISSNSQESLCKLHTMKIQLLLTTFILFFFGAVISQNPKSHTFSIVYYPSLSCVVINNYGDITISSFTREAYNMQKPDIPSYGYSAGVFYKYRLTNDVWVGIGILRSERESKTEDFFLRETSASRMFYKHKYRSIEVPIGVEYNLKRWTGAFFSAGVSADIYDGLRMKVYSIDPVSGKRNNSLTETHYPVKHGLLRIGTSIGFGYQFTSEYFYFSLCPEFKFYSNAFRTAKCPNCPQFVSGTIYSIGITARVGFSV
ncbi:MAG: PorT family protein [Saprospiraceae bacterium]|nr:PorT family protein [Saprospiraceae bacterium]